MNDDLISRDAVLDACSQSINILDAMSRIEDLPSVTPKQRTGHWIECEDEVKCFCSECKEISDYPTKFCPHCGAKMEEQA
jgi:hypothetical protein